MIASDRRHNSIDKACDALCLELIVVKADKETHALSLESLRRQLAELGPGINLKDAALVLTAGTVAVGAVDDLTMTRVLRGAHSEFSPAWVHVDSAWLGASMLSDALAPMLSGMEDADSCCFSVRGGLRCQLYYSHSHKR